jgi:hypothetical protein
VIGRGAAHGGEPTDDLPAGPPPTGPEAGSGGRRRWWANLSQSGAPAPAESAPDDLDLKPTAMRRPEPLYGYVVGLELILISILNLTVTHGKGAPTHPATLQSAVGLVASLAFIAVIRLTNHRLMVAFAAVIAAFCVTSLPRTPDSLLLAHLLAFAIPIVYAFMLSQRQRKAASALARAGRPGSAPAKGAASARNRPADAGGGRRGRRGHDAPAGPQASRRYTPPKAKRSRP